MFKMCRRFSVSLWSIIHSYVKFEDLDELIAEYVFRLLMEYHSFLSTNFMARLQNVFSSVFRLLMEYHSFLCSTLQDGVYDKEAITFSVSLWSIIHSYVKTWSIYILKVGLKFSVSLWSIIHSYLNDDIDVLYAYSDFPSPYGVSFILIW